MTSSSLDFAPTSNRFRSRGLALCAAAGAGCALAASARAQIVYSGVRNLSSTANGGAGSSVDLNEDGTADFTLAGADTSKALKITSFSQPGRVAATATTQVAKFSANTVISSTTLFSYTGSTLFFGTGAQWTTNDDGYIGIILTTGGHSYYGWGEIVTSTATGSATLVDWAYNSVPDASIMTGQGRAIPEPATAALVAGVLVLGGALWQKRRGRAKVQPGVLPLPSVPPQAHDLG